LSCNAHAIGRVTTVTSSGVAIALHLPDDMVAQGFLSVDSLVGVHALVVDADQECRRLLSTMLRYCGALVTTTASAADALNVMSIAKCDVVVVDLALPVESGFDLIRRIRALKPEQGGVVRTIALSERSRDREEALAAGFDAHLARPIDPWALCRTVSTLVLGHRDAR
jgi:CheY-like chemotaxis protein